MERHRAIAKMCLAGSFLAIKQKSKERRSGEKIQKRFSLFPSYTPRDFGPTRQLWRSRFTSYHLYN